MLFKLATSVTILAQLFALTTAQTISGPFDHLPAGPYTLYQNLWGRKSGVGSQNSTFISSSGNSVSWSTNWNWQNNPNKVKSYANVFANDAKGRQLSSINSAPTTWNWAYQTKANDIRADVSYDIWLGASHTGQPASEDSSYEIMIWLSRQGAIHPIGSPGASSVSLAGHSWTLWSGPSNRGWQVLSFVSDNGDIPSFKADLKEFFNYLVQNNGVSSQQFVQAIQAGTEPFTGSANLVTNSYSVSLN